MYLYLLDTGFQHKHYIVLLYFSSSGCLCSQTICSIPYVLQVAKPKLGENHPARVRADISILLSTRFNIRREWESLRKHDVAFLITVRPSNAGVARYNHKVSTSALPRDPKSLYYSVAFLLIIHDMYCLLLPQ